LSDPRDLRGSDPESTRAQPGPSDLASVNSGVVQRPAGLSLEGAARVHEVRNVLTAVRGWLDLARDGDPALVARAWAVMSDGLATAARLLDTTALDDAPRPFALDAVAARVADLLEASCVAQGVTLRREITPAEALGDDAKVAQVALNLGLNALRALRQKGSTLVVATGGDGEHARLVVADDGPGMDASVRARAFEPFFSTRPAEEGALRGVGLAVSLALAESMGGALEVRSEAGEGSEFTLRLPGARRPRALRGVSPAEVALRPGLRVLVVDDEASIRELLDVALTLRGAHVLAATEPGEARRAALRGEVDVALVDETLGGDRSGSALLAELALVAPGVGRVLMTGAAETAGLAAMASAALVRKPFLLEDVVRALSDADAG
jgi:CheY-like chemotaxis protein